MTLSIMEEIDWDAVPDDELEETILERLEGLKEMFPKKLRDKVSSTVGWSWWLLKGTSTIWVVSTSSLIMLMPYFVEKELHDIEKIQTKTQQQLLLGPGVKSIEKSK